MNNDLTDYPVCPYCKKEWKPDDLDACCEEGYIVGTHECKEWYGGCGKEFNVETYTVYYTSKIK